VFGYGNAATMAGSTHRGAIAILTVVEMTTEGSLKMIFVILGYFGNV
jgi:hypothetical protein